MSAPAAPPPFTSHSVFVPPAVRVLRRIGILSSAKVYGILSAGLGLVIGLFFALFALTLGGAMGAGMGPAEGAALAGVGVFAVVLFPLLYGAFGFLSGALFAALYNLCAKWVGGIEVTVE